MPTCAGCEERIVDQYLLRVDPDGLEWHAACLKCTDCGLYLDETRTCFVRNGKTYCRDDYHSRFTSKCVTCSTPFVRNDLVMRARDRIYHLKCFRCIVCERQLGSGEEFALTPDDNLCCRADLDVIAAVTSSRCTSGKLPADETGSTDDDVIASIDTNVSGKSLNNNNEDELKTSYLTESDNAFQSANSQSNSSSISGKNLNGSENRRASGGSRSHKSSDQKTTRIRTVLNEKQLHTLRTCYGANPRPDALMKEQLVEMTGLSPRVIRVWFQNKRCKDKKRSILLKQIQQHHQDEAVSMVAASPIRHDAQSGLTPVAVHQYQLLSWPGFLPGSSSVSDLHVGYGQCAGIVTRSVHHLQEPSELNQQPPPFQRLLNSFGNLGSDEDDDDDDDGVVSLPEENTTSRGLLFAVSEASQRQRAMRINDITKPYVSGVKMTSSSAAATAAAILSVASSSFGSITVAQQAVRC